VVADSAAERRAGSARLRNNSGYIEKKRKLIMDVA
jgi:hypothetical protein